MSSLASISKNMFLAKRRGRNWRRTGIRVSSSMRFYSLPGDYDAIDFTTTRNTQVSYIDPPSTREKRVWVHNANPLAGNQHFVFAAGGNIDVSDGYVQIYPGQFIAFSWDGSDRIWRVISRPFRLDGGYAVYTGELGTTGLILNSDNTPLKWEDGKYMVWQ